MSGTLGTAEIVRISLQNPKSRGDNTKTRHIGVKDRYAREAQSHGYINVVKIATDDHVADLLTKTLPPTLFQRVYGYFVPHNRIPRYAR